MSLAPLFTITSHKPQKWREDKLFIPTFSGGVVEQSMMSREHVVMARFQGSFPHQYAAGILGNVNTVEFLDVAPGYMLAAQYKRRPCLSIHDVAVFVFCEHGSFSKWNELLIRQQGGKFKRVYHPIYPESDLNAFFGHEDPVEK